MRCSLRKVLGRLLVDGRGEIACSIVGNVPFPLPGGGMTHAPSADWRPDILVRLQAGSTNDELRVLAMAGARHGTVLRAVEQTAGRGRHGRVWASPPGNLYMSVLLRCERPLRHMAEVGFLLALATADAVDAALPPGASHARLKWPNDVQVDGAKIAGVLTELLDTRSGPAVIAGVGLNVAHAPAGLPYPATCLHARGATGSEVGTVATMILSALGRRWAAWLRSGFGPTREDWLRRGPAPGTPLAVSLPGGTVHGTFADLDGDGALVLRTEDGCRRFVAGDVVPGTAPGYGSDHGSRWSSAR